MLVLSRRPEEKILFPTLGITVEIRNISKNVVRVGIEAPPSVAIVRAEIASEADKTALADSQRHRLRNRLHTASLAVHLAQKQLQAGLAREAEVSLSEAMRQYEELDREMVLAKNKAPTSERQISALLVEDNYNESMLLAEFLRLHGIRVETAKDGQDALDYLRSHERPDVILLDMRMPRCDGPSTVAAIGRDAAYDGLKVFAVSGASPHELSETQGLDGWFHKPVNPTKLIHEMNLALGRN